MSSFYGKMKDYEIEFYRQAVVKIQHLHISTEAAKRLKHILDICTIQESLPTIDSKEDTVY